MALWLGGERFLNRPEVHAEIFAEVDEVVVELPLVVHVAAGVHELVHEQGHGQLGGRHLADGSEGGFPFLAVAGFVDGGCVGVVVHVFGVLRQADVLEQFGVGGRGHGAHGFTARFAFKLQALVFFGPVTGGGLGRFKLDAGFFGGFHGDVHGQKQQHLFALGNGDFGVLRQVIFEGVFPRDGFLAFPGSLAGHRLAEINILGAGLIVQCLAYPFNSAEAAELSIPMLMFVIKRHGSKALCGWSDSGPPLHPVTFCNN